MSKQDFVDFIDDGDFIFSPIVLGFAFIYLFSVIAYADLSVSELNFNYFPNIILWSIGCVFVLEALFISFCRYVRGYNLAFYAKLKFFCILLTIPIVSIVYGLGRITKAIIYNIPTITAWVKSVSPTLLVIFLWIVGIAAFFSLNLWIAYLMNNKRKRRAK